MIRLKEKIQCDLKELENNLRIHNMMPTYKKTIQLRGHSLKYPCISIRGRYYLLHRLIMQFAIGRTLTGKEVVHHKNGNILDCTLKNLEIMSAKEHANTMKVYRNTKYKDSPRVHDFKNINDFKKAYADYYNKKRRLKCKTKR